MEKELAQGPIGSVGKYEVELKDGSLVVTGQAELGPASMTVEMKVEGKKVLDALIAKMPEGLAKEAVEAMEKAILGA